MNNGNAAGFLCLGAAMWLLPVLNPSWFPPVAVDGSSTRALWLQLMGAVEFAFGFIYLLRHGCIPALVTWRKSAVRRGAIATGEWQTDALPASILAVDCAAGGVPTEQLRLRTRMQQLARLRGALRTTALASVSGSRDSLLQLVRASFTDLHRLYSTKPDEFDQYALEMLSELLHRPAADQAAHAAGPA